MMNYSFSIISFIWTLLDVEGAEESILKAIPWNKIYIELVTIEVNHSDEKEIRRIMKDAGYEIYMEIQERGISLYYISYS